MAGTAADQAAALAAVAKVAADQPQVAADQISMTRSRFRE